MLIGLATATGLVAALTLLPLSPSKRWWVRGLDFPRLQLAALAAAALAADLAALGLSAEGVPLAASAAACLAYQLSWIAPYSRLTQPDLPNAAPGAPAALRILAANVLATNRRWAGLLAVVRRADPDIVVTVETNRWWEQRLRPLESDYPHVVRCPLENLYGMHVYSRLPLESAEVRFLIKPGIPSVRASVRLPGGARVALHFVHPEPPRPATDGSAPRDVELLRLADEIRRTNQPTVVAGDLNDVAWSRTTARFLQLTGLKDPRVGRGMLNTFHARFCLLRWPLDHFFASRHFALARLVRLPKIGSDHFPVMVELAWRGGGQA